MSIIKSNRPQTTPAQPEQQPSELVLGLMAKEHQQLHRALSARRDELLAEIRDARITAGAAKQLRAAAEAQWQLNEPDHHSVTEAQRLEQRRREDAAASARVAELAASLEEVEGQLRDVTRDAKREHALKVAAEVWPPARRKMMQAARVFVAALEEQDRVIDRLEDAGARGLIDGEQLVMGDAAFRDPCATISRWLRQCERDGFK